MLSSKQLEALKARAKAQSSKGSKTYFPLFDVKYTGASVDEHHPYKKDADGNFVLKADGSKDRNDDVVDGYVTHFSQPYTDYKVMVVFPKEYKFDFYGDYQVGGLGYRMRSANMIYIDEDVKVTHIKGEEQ